MNKLIILPGYSPHNKYWAEEVKDKLKRETKERIIVHEWSHWNLGSFSLKKELDRIVDEIDNEKTDIIAKSVGVAVAMELIPRIAPQAGKIVFCGIASVEGSDREESLKNVLKVLPVENILCIQNENDKFVIYKDAERFYHSVNPEIKVVSKPRSDHNYPFYEDFKEFLSDSK
jgi:predicted alpha/beta hydrolase family esterase